MKCSKKAKDNVYVTGLSLLSPNLIVFRTYKQVGINNEHNLPSRNSTLFQRYVRRLIDVGTTSCVYCVVVFIVYACLRTNAKYNLIGAQGTQRLNNKSL